MGDPLRAGEVVKHGHDPGLLQVEKGEELIGGVT